MKSRFHPTLPAFTLAFAIITPAHAQPVQDFQLPPAPTPTATPNVQGPVDTDGVVPVRPRTIPTVTPTTQAPPTPLPTLDTILPPPSDAVTGGGTSRSQPSGGRVAPVPQPQTADEPIQVPAGPDNGSPAAAHAPQAQVALDAPTPSATPATVPDAPRTSLPIAPFWLWVAGVAALLVAALATLFMRRRQALASAPTIERPIVPNAARTDTQPTTRPALALRVEALSLSRSLMNATLAYRVTILNRTNDALIDVQIEADLVSASSDRPVEQQIALPTTVLEERHRTPRMSANQNVRFEGQVQLPLAQASVVRQGKAALLIPLLRVRVTARNTATVAKTFVIGQANAGGSTRLQPFALDDGPRSWRPIAQRQLD